MKRVGRNIDEVLEHYLFMLTLDEEEISMKSQQISLSIPGVAGKAMWNRFPLSTVTYFLS